jgi:hypothetical protein
MSFSIVYASSHLSFIQEASQFIKHQSPDSLIVVPHRKALSWVRRALTEHSSGHIPKLISLDMPLGYFHSCFMEKKPLSKTQSLAWMIQFLDSNGYKESSLTHTLTVAWSLLELWERAQNITEMGEELEKIPFDRLSQHSQKTIEILKLLVNSWPSFLSEKGYCSSFDSKKEGLKPFLSQQNFSSLFFIGIDPQEKSLSQIKNSFNPQWHSVFFLPSQTIVGPPRKDRIASEKSEKTGPRDSLALPCLSDEFFTSLEPHQKNIKCRTTMDQARTISFLVHYFLKNPKDTVAIVDVSPSLLIPLSHEMARWGIPFTLSDEPLLGSFLEIFLQGVLNQWSLPYILKLAHHPLVVKRWPVALLMAAKAETMDLSNEGLPLWAKKALSFIKGASQPLLQMEGSGEQPLWKWLESHISGAVMILGDSFKDPLLMVLEEWMKISSNFLSLSQYSEFVSFLITKLYHGFSLSESHPRVFLTTKEDLSFLCPDHTLITSTQEFFLPWLPPSMKELFQISFAQEIHKGWSITLSEDAHKDENSPLQKWTDSLDQEYPLKEGLNVLNFPAPLGMSPEFSKEPSCSDAISSLPSQPVDPLKNSHQVLSSSFGVATLPKEPMNLSSFFPPLTYVSLSDIQLWRTDFTNFYKRKILRIRPQTLSDSQIWGMKIHTVMEKVITECPPSLRVSSQELFSRLKDISHEIMPPMDFIKRHMLDTLCQSMAHYECQHREQGVIQSVTECDGRITFSFSCHNKELLGFYKENYPSRDPNFWRSIHLTARADRLDLMEDGSLHIIDYKTGAPPPFSAIDSFQSVQLPLEALIADPTHDPAWGSGWAIISSPELVLPEDIYWKKTGPGFPISGTVSSISWWHLSLSKGCVIKNYPRPLSPLLDQYKTYLPYWMYALASGKYDPL